MNNAGSVLNPILGMLSRGNDDAVVARVKNILRIELKRVCQKFSIAALRVKDTIDFSDTVNYDEGMLLRSDLLGIDTVRDNNDLPGIERNRSDIDPREYGFRYYRRHPSTTGLALGTDVNVTNEGTTFTSASLTAAGTAVSGEYIRFGTGLEYYLITNDTTPFTFGPTYYGPTIVGGDYVIRPPETQRMVLLTAAEVVIQDISIDVYGWKAPDGIYRDIDLIPLPDTEYLSLKILRRLPEAKEKRPVSTTELKDAYSDLQRMMPDFPRLQDPRDKHNHPMNFNTNVFTDRERRSVPNARPPR